jgi:CheY-like chemotaxis protein
MLINDILDLSKIESGTVMVDASELRLDDLNGYVERTFRHVAESKGVDFLIRFDARLPKSMFTDSKRLQQIIKNLLSNAFKFTHHGQVKLTVEPASVGWSPDNEELNRAVGVLAFAVSDTGIGIPTDKQQIIFEAFQQVDGSTSRKYGGTGLGLAISRELSRLLGGEIRLTSAPEHGSTFTLYLPTSYATSSSRKSAVLTDAVGSRLAGILDKSIATIGNGNGRANDIAGPFASRLEPAALNAPALFNEVGDDRDLIRPGDQVFLIVENDLDFARILLDAARERGFRGLVTSLGVAALTMTREYKPAAISLDIHLPDIDGWRVLERLKNDVTTRHIPVCVISTDESRARALASGSFAFVAKPIQSRDVLDGLLVTLEEFVGRCMKSLLVIEPDTERSAEVLKWVAAEDVQITTVPDAEAAMQMLRERRIDCVVVNPQVRCPDDSLRDVGIQGNGELGQLPIIVFGNGDGRTDGEWKRAFNSCSIRRAHSPARLLDLSAFFLHRNVATMPAGKRQVLHDLHQSDKLLAGKRVLIVDDDMRNIFALSTVLEEHDMVIVSADNGRDAIEILHDDPAIDIVLMDIMMPELDGMETMREIRKVPRFKDLPIVAVTAKAMKGDREKCIEAGAWDYLSKPVDTEQMLAVLRAWLHR